MSQSDTRRRAFEADLDFLNAVDRELQSASACRRKLTPEDRP